MLLGKTIHLGQNLVEGLFPFIMSAPHTSSPGTADGVDFIDEDNRRSFLLRRSKHVAYPRGPDTDKHFDEFRTTDTEKRHIRFTGHRFGEQCLAGSRWTHQQNPLRDFGTQLEKFLRLLEVIDDFMQIPLGILKPGNIIKGNVHTPLEEPPRLRLTETEQAKLPTTHALAHIAAEIIEDRDNQ